jgi:hypothetical protein
MAETMYTVRRASSAGTPSRSGADRKYLQKTCWRLIDWYRHTGQPIDVEDFYATMTDPNYKVIDQCVIELTTSMKQEAVRRGVKVAELEEELEARAETEGWPSATGVLPWETPGKRTV